MIDNAKRASFIIATADAGGCEVDDDDVRDAAHEIAHVFQVRRDRGAYRGPWERENTHKQLVALAKSDARKTLVRYEAQLVVLEYEARAVEWLVCDALRVPYEVDHWVDMMLLETIHTLQMVPPGGIDGNRNRIETYKKRRRTIALADKVLALGAS